MSDTPIQLIDLIRNLTPNCAGLFDRHQPLRGRDWLRRIPNEDRQAFSLLGRTFFEHGRLGGKARAASAARDRRGRFIPNPQPAKEPA